MCLCVCVGMVYVVYEDTNCIMTWVYDIGVTRRR